MKQFSFLFGLACLLVFPTLVSAQSFINDADGNTSVETNRLGLNDDIIWLRSGGLDRLRVKGAQLEFLNTGGSIFIGEAAGASDDLTNNLNLFVGDEAGTSTVSGAENVAIGRRALFSNTTGDGNMAVGSTTLYRTTTGSQNAGIGKATLFENTTGSRNVGIGFSTLRNATTADDNVAIGSRAGFNTTIGAQNVLIGTLAGFNNQQGGQNVMVGHEAGRGVGALHNKSGCVFLGYQAGYNEMTSNKLYIENSNSTLPLIYGEFDNDVVRVNGNIGIGTYPNAPFHVNVPSSSGVAARVQVAGSTKFQVFENGGVGIGIFATGNIPDNGLQVFGDVNIGNDHAVGYKLSVDGKIAAEELLVELNASWPDYVFEQGYELKNMEDLEQYIQQNGHLPNIPSAAEVAEKGFEVGEMHRLTVEKVEELTLYAIDADKKIKAQQEEAEALKDEVKALKEANKALEEKVAEILKYIEK